MVTVSASPDASGTAAARRRRSLLGRLVSTFRFWADPSSRPLPEVEADLGWWVPVWLVTLALAGVAIAGVALVVRAPVGWLVMGAFVLALVVFPEGPSTGVYAIAIGVAVLITGGEPFTGRLFLLIALVHLVAVLDSVTSGLPLRARLQVAALRDPLRRYLGVQVAAQAIAAVGALLSGAAITLAWIPVIAALGLAVFSWALDARIDAGGRPEHRVR